MRPSSRTVERREMTYVRELGRISNERDRCVVEDPLFDVKRGIDDVEEKF